MFVCDNSLSPFFSYGPSYPTGCPSISPSWRDTHLFVLSPHQYYRGKRSLVKYDPHLWLINLEWVSRDYFRTSNANSRGKSFKKENTCYDIIDCVFILRNVGGGTSQRSGCLALAAQCHHSFIIKISFLLH